MTTNRRNFLRKTGLVLGATVIAGTTGNLVLSSPVFDSSKLTNIEQVKLLTRFEKWVNNYIDVVEDEKVKNREFKDNKELISLPDELEKWMPELKKHLSDKQFATEYLKVSDRLTHAIDSQF
jgi:hypothetical protein